MRLKRSTTAVAVKYFSEIVVVDHMTRCNTDIFNDINKKNVINMDLSN